MLPALGHAGMDGAELAVAIPSDPHSAKGHGLQPLDHAHQPDRILADMAEKGGGVIGTWGRFEPIA